MTKVRDLRNLSQTMGGLIRNIVGEVEDQREQMFRIVEDIAAIEICGRKGQQWRKRF